MTKDKPMVESGQHCERKCDFPSACHWKTKHTPTKATDFEFLDPKSLDKEGSSALPVSALNNPSTLKKTGLYIDKIVKAAEKRTSQLTTLLSTIDEEKNFTSSPGYVPAPISSPPKLPELPSLNGLGLSFPVMDFSNLKSYLDSPRSTPKEEPNPNPAPPESSRPSLSISPTPTSEDDNDVDMTDWLSSSEDSISPTSKSVSVPPFDFRLDPAHSPQASLADEEEDEDASPVSPRRNAWDWTAGDIGVALGSPTNRLYEEGWEGAMMEEEEEEMEGAWERELGLSD